MRIRALQRDDQGALLRIWNEGASHDPLTPALLEEKIWGDPDCTPMSCVVAETARRPIGFAVGVVRSSGTGYVKLLAVDRARRREGIGSSLLQAVEKLLANGGARTVRLLEAAPNYLTPGIDSRYKEALMFAADCGYRAVGEATNLSVDLGEGLWRRRQPPVASDIEIRRASGADEEALCSFLAENWPTWQPEAMTALRNDPPTLHVALCGPSVVGFAAFDANNKGTGWFGPMGVSPTARLGGVGRSLLNACLDDLCAQGHGHAEIAWVDSVPFYEKSAGAKRSRTFIRFEKKLAT